MGSAILSEVFSIITMFLTFEGPALHNALPGWMDAIADWIYSTPGSLEFFDNLCKQYADPLLNLIFEFIFS